MTRLLRPEPIQIGDTVSMPWGGGVVTGTVVAIRDDRKAIIRRDGKTDVVRSLAFLDRVSPAKP